MANTEAYKKQVETWFLNELIGAYPKNTLSKGKVKLNWGGEFEYDIVIKNDAHDIEAVYCLSCSNYKTSSGKGGSGKLLKIKADAMMMLGTDVEKKVLAFTGKSMYDKIKSEQEKGRFPLDITLEYIDLQIRNNVLFDLVERTMDEASSEIKTVSLKPKE